MNTRMKQTERVNRKGGKCFEKLTQIHRHLKGKSGKMKNRDWRSFFFLKKSAVYHLQCFVLLACYYSFMNSSESGLFEYTTGISSQWDAVSSQGITHTLFCTLPKELTNPVHSDRHPWPSPLAPARISVSTCPMYFLIHNIIYIYICIFKQQQKKRIKPQRPWRGWNSYWK